jgi:hypothetical protein
VASSNSRMLKPRCALRDFVNKSFMFDRGTVP